MTKAEVVNEIAKKTGIEKTVVLSTVEAFMDVVKESLSNHEPVYLRGFGSFIIKERAEKTARDIHKKATLIIPAHSIPAFKPAKTFVNEVKK
ncbi:MAG: integration host factor subunit beta [Bacteroidaceae bacterium]|jgi:DNA-binding protein HU-beta|nr:integration host factor subunit beta [Bacteroidaceae bacterium]MBO7281582.1 integration host factor subunit beta [Bacteroidaceae bacterium]